MIRDAATQPAPSPAPGPRSLAPRSLAPRSIPPRFTEPAPPARHAGWASGLIGVLIFSASLPATRVAVAGFTPLFLTAARASLAALLGAVLLLALRQPRPQRSDLLPLTIVSLGVVVGFPLLTALALEQITAARSVVYIGLLPLATALFAVLRGGERPRAAFWLFSLLGSATVAAFAVIGAPVPMVGPDAGSIGTAGAVGLADTASGRSGDLLMVAAIVACGLGYAEGAVLTRRLGGWQVISWSLLLSLPPMAALALLTWPARLPAVDAPAWWGLGYVTVFSMLIGFVFWYRGLALGGIARVGQLQLLQPLFGLMLAAALLGETVAPAMIVATVAVIACVALARRFG